MKITALAGGVGGAKLIDGLSRVLNPSELSVIVNTGDDFIHYGLHISPDLDTITYTLGGMANPFSGWGRFEETYNMISSLEVLGGQTWFLLGDKDLAVHLERTRLLNQGYPLSSVTSKFCHAWGIKQLILPMTDNDVRTVIDTVESGELSFQQYFVENKYRPQVKNIYFSGIETASPAPGVLEAIEQADGVIISPSNPWVSIDPISHIPGIGSALKKKIIIAVSPIISGSAIKGPAAKMFSEMGIQPSSVAVFRHYSQYLSGFVLDNIDKSRSHEIPIPTLVTQTIMKSTQDRVSLAQSVIDFLQTL